MEYAQYGHSFGPCKTKKTNVDRADPPNQKEPSGYKFNLTEPQIRNQYQIEITDNLQCKLLE